VYLHQSPLPFEPKGADAAMATIGNPLTLGGTPSAKTPMAQAGLTALPTARRSPG